MAVWFQKISSASTHARKFRPFAVLNHQASTVVNSEIDNHNKLADKWWDEGGEMKPLHALNKLRIKLIKDGLINTGLIEQDKCDGPEPLKGIKLLEVGCGGGILTEPLARLGADVTGLDASPKMISTAQLHAAKYPDLDDRLRYIHATIEEHVCENVEAYNTIIASEVLEHLTQKQLFMNSCAIALKPGGSFFITTINKTLLSWLGAIVAAEKILRMVPNGTHTWDMFISPQEVEAILDTCDCDTRLVHGMMYNFLTNQWHWSSNTSINYALHAVKRKCGVHCS